MVRRFVHVLALLVHDDELGVLAQVKVRQERMANDLPDNGENQVALVEAEMRRRTGMRREQEYVLLDDILRTNVDQLHAHLAEKIKVSETKDEAIKRRVLASGDGRVEVLGLVVDAHVAVRSDVLGVDHASLGNVHHFANKKEGVKPPGRRGSQGLTNAKEKRRIDTAVIRNRNQN